MKYFMCEVNYFMNIKELYNQFANVDIGDLSNNQKKSIRSSLM